MRRATRLSAGRWRSFRPATAPIRPETQPAAPQKAALFPAGGLRSQDLRTGLDPDGFTVYLLCDRKTLRSAGSELLQRFVVERGVSEPLRGLHEHKDDCKKDPRHPAAPEFAPLHRVKRKTSATNCTHPEVAIRTSSRTHRSIQSSNWQALGSGASHATFPEAKSKGPSGHPFRFIYGHTTSVHYPRKGADGAPFIQAEFDGRSPFANSGNWPPVLLTQRPGVGNCIYVPSGRLIPGPFNPSSL